MLTTRQMVGQCLSNFKDVAGMLEILKKNRRIFTRRCQKPGTARKEVTRVIRG